MMMNIWEKLKKLKKLNYKKYNKKNNHNHQLKRKMMKFNLQNNLTSMMTMKDF
jgi:hypothetical protein